MKKLKIAITCKDSSRIWTNGLTQNAYFLIGLLNEAGYEAEAVSQFEEAGKNLEEFEIKKLSIDTIKNYDIVIEVCYSVTDNLLDYALKNGVKLVTINYGNIFTKTFDVKNIDGELKGLQIDEQLRLLDNVIDYVYVNFRNL